MRRPPAAGPPFARQDKEAKVAYLEKLIAAVGLALGAEVPAKPLKVRAALVTWGPGLRAVGAGGRACGFRLDSVHKAAGKPRRFGLRCCSNSPQTNQIVAGLEPENTNVLLQMLGRAARAGDGAEAVRVGVAVALACASRHGREMRAVQPADEC